VELVSEIEEMLREELRTMIKDNAPSSEVNHQVDAILEKMDSVKVAVPEFGSIVTIALAIAVIGTIIATSKRTGLSMISRR
jgi:predicted secreted protein with PEFG-CTERM motif